MNEFQPVLSLEAYSDDNDSDDISNGSDDNDDDITATSAMVQMDKIFADAAYEIDDGVKLKLVNILTAQGADTEPLSAPLKGQY